MVLQQNSYTVGDSRRIYDLAYAVRLAFPDLEFTTEDRSFDVPFQVYSKEARLVIHDIPVGDRIKQVCIENGIRLIGVPSSFSFNEKVDYLLSLNEDV